MICDLQERSWELLYHSLPPHHWYLEVIYNAIDVLQNFRQVVEFYHSWICRVFGVQFVDQFQCVCDQICAVFRIRQGGIKGGHVSCWNITSSFLQRLNQSTSINGLVIFQRIFFLYSCKLNGRSYRILPLSLILACLVFGLLLFKLWRRGKNGYGGERRKVGYGGWARGDRKMIEYLI